MNCFQRVAAEQGIAAFWRGNLVNCIRYFPTQVGTKRAHVFTWSLVARWLRRHPFAPSPWWRC